MIEPNNLLSDALLESRRFGLRVVHGAYDRLPVGDLRRALIAARADVAIIRVPTDAPDTMASLQRLGLDFLVADTLVYYLSDLSKYEPLALRNRDLVFSLATDLNREELAALVRVTFEGYRNHYFSNPLFTKEKILEGYEEWATSFITAGNDRQLWLVRREGRLVAFAACSVAQGGDAAEGVLFAVDADAAGGGIYGDLIRFTQRQYRSRGCSKMYVSTQVHNYAVQKVWMREGFHMVSSWLTLHINALLSHSTRPIEEFDLAVTPDLIASYAETTGDRNPIHLDDGAAKRAGLRGAARRTVARLAEWDLWPVE